MTHIFDRLFGNLYLRKLYHMLGGILILCGLVFLDKAWFILMAGLYYLLFLLIGKRISFAIIGILLLYLLSNSRNLTLYATIIWWIGDFAAGVVGAAWGKQKLPWNPQKSILGSLSFFFSSFLVIFPMLIQTNPTSLKFLLPLCSLACLVACIVESLPITFIRDRKPDDNLTVILSTGFTLWVCAQVFDLRGML